MRVNITMPIETLAQIIAKAREMEADVAEDEDLETDEEIFAEGEDEAELAEDEETVEDFDDDQLTDLLAGLRDDQLAELLALIWVGGGDYGEEDWDEALSRARALNDNDVLTHLLGADDLSDLIEDGLIELGYAVLIEDDAAAA